MPGKASLEAIIAPSPALGTRRRGRIFARYSQKVVLSAPRGPCGAGFGLRTESIDVMQRFPKRPR
jgi:hypothetical protein